MSDPSEVDPAWLGQVLRSAGVLDGDVAHVQVQETDAFNSHTLKLRVHFAPSGGQPPARLVLKRTIDKDWAIAAAVREVGFYRLVASLADHPQVIPPYVASGLDDPATGRPWLLLEDLSATHASPFTRDQQLGSDQAVPSQQHIAQATATLARLHGYWWEHPLQHSGVLELADWFRDPQCFDTRLVQRRTAAWHWVRDNEPEHLPPGARDLYEHVLPLLPAYWQTWLRPRADGTGLTLLHGDAYFANYLCPRDTTHLGTAYLLDWQHPGFSIGALDLVNLCATFRTASQRREQLGERRILRDYHTQLTATGVTGHTLDDLHRDYQLGIIYWLLVPLQDAHSGSAPTYWRPKMQSLIAAFHDWNCDQILTPTRS